MVGISASPQIVLMRVEAALSQIKDIIHEVAFCCPVLSVRVTAETKVRPCSG